ncbi:uncharacterized protein BDV14DRAFT_194851 [Aspergillus stella-maris]|uniref:uncharacterized protein n=1 Tax=Aspergillus stella-maris TaxID=1810926 RepID=UPI003CCDD965
MSIDQGDGDLIDRFLNTYRLGIHPSQHRARKVAEVCGQALKAAGVPHNIEQLGIDIKQLEGELKMRTFVREMGYHHEEEIETDVMNLARVSVELHLPSQQKRVSAIIKKSFEEYWPQGTANGPMRRVENMNSGTNSYWVSLKEEQEMWPPRIAEIQVSVDPGDREFRNQHELGTLLCKWAVINGRSENCGDVRPLWELMGHLDLRRIDVFRDILERLDMSTKADSEFARKAGEFQGLEFSLAMYVTERLMRLPCATKRIEDSDNFLKRGPVAQQHRHEVEMVRNSFIWLAYLYSWGAGAGKMLLGNLDKGKHDIQQMRISWLDKKCTKNFFNGETAALSVEESHDLRQLWLLFDSHPRLPAQYVFNLARLGVKGHSPPCWPDFRRAIFNLVYA